MTGSTNQIVHLLSLNSRSSRPFTGLISLLALSSSAAAQQKKVHYDIAFPNAAQHEAQVTATFAGLARGTTLHVRMSRSSPGRYAPAAFAKNVWDVIATDGHGKTLSVTRPDSHGWDVAGHDGTVRIHYTAWGDRIDGTYLSIDHSHARMNMPATFMWAHGLEMAPIRLTIHPQPGWQVATQLVPVDSTVFTAPNLQYFMDSPTEVGPVTWRRWTGTYNGTTSTWRIAVHHLGTEAQVDTFVTMVKRVVAEEVAMWGEPAGYDYGTYTFLADYLPWAGGDAMEHRNSTFLSNRRGMETRPYLIDHLGNLAHEFFHSWNMERLRSKEVEPFDFDRENMSDALWFGEGFTNYFHPLMIRRAGLYTDSEYVAQLGRAIVGTMTAVARNHGSPVDMSRDAVFFDGGTSLDPSNQTNIFLSYYTWGSVVAAGLDLTLRERFHKSLDDYMRLLWQDYGKHQSKALAPERPYTVAILRAELGKLVGDKGFADDFFRRYVDGREVPDFASLLTPAGMVLVKDPATPYFGASMENDPKGVFINWSAPGSSAYTMGLASGDMVLSIDGEPTTTIVALNAIIARHKVGDVLKVEYLQKEATSATVPMTLVGRQAMRVTTFENAGMPVTDGIRAFRRDWLGSKVKQ